MGLEIFDTPLYFLRTTNVMKSLSEMYEFYKYLTFSLPYYTLLQ